MASGGLAKDVQYLLRHVAALSNGQAVVTDVDDNLEFLKLDILPNDGFYKGAKIQFKIVFTEEYPNEVPQVLCLDRVYHPNIDVEYFADSDDGNVEGSNVCVSLLDEWDPSMDLDHIVMAILFLMYHPNPDDALSTYFDSESHEDMEENIRLTLRGEMLDDTAWPRLLVADEDEASVKAESGHETVAPPTPETEQKNENVETVATPTATTPEETTPAVVETTNNSEMEAEVAAGTETDNINTDNFDDSNSKLFNSERMLKHQRSAMSLDDLNILSDNDSVTSPVIEDQAELNSVGVARKGYPCDIGTGVFPDMCSPCFKALFCNLYTRESDRQVQAFVSAQTINWVEDSEVD